MADCELQSSLRACDNGRKHFQRGFCCLFAAAFRGRVKNVLVFALWKSEGPDVSPDQSDPGIRYEVGTLPFEGFWITRQDRGLRPKTKELVYQAKALQ